MLVLDHTKSSSSCGRKLVARTIWQHLWVDTRLIDRWLFVYEGQLLLDLRVTNCFDSKDIFSISFFDWPQNAWAVKDNVGRLAIIFSSLYSYSFGVLISRVEDAEDCLYKDEVSSVSNLKVYTFEALFSCKTISS